MGVYPEMLAEHALAVDQPCLCLWCPTAPVGLTFLKQQQLQNQRT